MSLFELQRYIFELWSGDPATAAVDPTDYDIEPDELRLVEEKDLAGLYEAGVHPVLIMQFSRSRDIKTDEIKRQLKKAPAPKGRTPRWRN